MEDIVEVRKVNKDENWMDWICFSYYLFFTSHVVPLRSCQTRKE